MRFSTLVAGALAAVSVTADQYFWRHDSEWASGANWVKGAAPSPTTFAAFGVEDASGSPSKACDHMDAVVNIPEGVQQTTGGLVIGKGVAIQIGRGSELVIGKTTGNAVTQWKCKAAQDVDYRCSANWQIKKGDVLADVGTIPCGTDDIVFAAPSFNVDNSGVPVVKSVKIAGKGFDTATKITKISEDYVGLATAFVSSEAFNPKSDPMTDKAAELSCMNSCPKVAEAAGLIEKHVAYDVEHNHLIQRQEFLTGVRAQLGESYRAIPQDRLTKREQSLLFGRATLYVYNNKEAKKNQKATLQIDSSVDDHEAFIADVTAKVKTHFTEGKNADCLDNFNFHPDSCVPLVGFGGDKVNACVDGDNIQFDECPKSNSIVCPDPAHINVATRFAVENNQFREVTCGDFEDIDTWFSANQGLRNQVSKNCCEPRAHVAVIGCGFKTDDMQFKSSVEMYKSSLIDVTKAVLHGASRGNAVDKGQCEGAFMGDVSHNLAVNLNTATGGFLASGDNEDLDTTVAVAAIATSGLAKSLVDYNVADKDSKNKDFDQKFHLKKFRGADPDNGRRRRKVSDVIKKIEAKLEDEMPFPGMTLGGIGDSDEGGAEVVVKDMNVNWFQRDSIATVDTATIESYIADVLLVFAMEAEEYDLKVAEYAFLTTSTTTTATTTITTTITTVTPAFLKSGTSLYVTDEKTGAELCRVAESPCPADKKVEKLASAVTGAKEEFKQASEAAQEKINAAAKTIEDLRADMKTKSDTYKKMKAALDTCDKIGVDKLSVMSYPDTCSDELEAYNKAADDFVAFANGGVGLDFDARISKVYTDQTDAMDDLSKLQAQHSEHLQDLMSYDDAVHGNEDTASYKSPEEVKDLQTSFAIAAAEVEALALLVEETKDDFESMATGSNSMASTEKKKLEDAKKLLQAAVDKCKETEDNRLADVPDPILSGKYLAEELKLKTAAIENTCRPFTAELGAIQKQLDNNQNKFDAFKTAAEEATETTKELEDEIKVFETEKKPQMLESLNTRVEEDEAFPLLYIVAAGAGALVLILVIALVISSTGNSARGNAYGGDSWGSGGDNTTVAFENPVYDDNGPGQFTAGEVGGDEEEDGGLYDEPEMFADGGADAGAGAGAGGGYLDVEPDDDDEDEEDEDEDEEEDEEEDEDDDDEEEDESEEDDDEDDEDEDDSDE
jgi:hypothetical protein